MRERVRPPWSPHKFMRRLEEMEVTFMPYENYKGTQMIRRSNDRCEEQITLYYNNHRLSSAVYEFWSFF